MHQFTILKNDDGSANVLLLGHGEPRLAHSSHASYKNIVQRLTAESDPDYTGPVTQTDEWVRLFDPGKAVEDRFQALSERVSVQNGHILLDGDPLEDAFTEPIIRFLDEGIDNWKPLVAFLESVSANPSQNSRAQLSEWVQNQEGITLTAEGNIVGYKGVRREGDGSMLSIHSGEATVQRPGEDPKVITGRIPNEVGSVVTMPRSEVVDDPNTHCNRGLHVGTQRYASSYGQVMLEVHVSPRDVVSVPNDANGEKIRVCRYTIVKVLEPGFKYTGALRPEDAVEALDDHVEDDGDLVGRRASDEDGDEGVLQRDEYGNLSLVYDDDAYGSLALDDDEVADEDDDGAAGTFVTLLPETQAQRRDRIHGKGGATSQAAKGRGKNPAQDATGRFSNGRPGSQRGTNGQFTG